MAREETAAGAGSGSDCAVTAVHLTQDQITGQDISPCLSAGNPTHGQASIGVICLNDQGGNVMGTSVDVAGTLRAQEHGHAPIMCAGFQHKAGSRTRGIGYEAERLPTLTSEQLAAVYDARGNGDGKTACTQTGDHKSRVTDYTAIVMATGQAAAEITRDACPTLNCNHEQPIVMGVACRNATESAEVVATLQAHNNGGFSLNCTHPVRIGPQVCRLTPLECERLQGYPDG